VPFTDEVDFVPFEATYLKGRRDCPEKKSPTQRSQAPQNEVMAGKILSDAVLDVRTHSS
jgi:hypothetical protein